MISNVELEVVGKDDGTRLDAFILSCFPGSTRALVRDAISGHYVRLRGRSASKGEKVRSGDVVAVDELLEAADVRVAPDASILPRIVYDDGILLAADKPAGMPVQPLSPRERGTLMNGLVAIYPGLAEVGDEPLIAGAVHRIDAGTSGLVVVARSGVVFDAMRQLFARHEVEKTYLAMVEGRVTRPGRVSCDLLHDPTLPFCKMIRAGEGAAGKGMHAETAFAPLHTAGANTLLEVRIATGVTHQIRSQLAMAGHPIVGDVLYGARALKGAEGTFRLHSLSAAFVHPTTGERIRIETSLPSWA